MGSTAYTRDETYRTLRKRGNWYLDCRLTSGSFAEVERYGWYRKPGVAATAVGASTYRAALGETTDVIRDSLQQRLDEIGLGAIPKPALRHHRWAAGSDPCRALTLPVDPAGEQ